MYVLAALVRLTLVTIVLPLFVLIGHPAEAAKWTNPFTLGLENSSHPHVAIDPKGNAVSVWTQSNGETSYILAGKLPCGGTWSKPATISYSSNKCDNASVVLDKRGNAVAVWTVVVDTNNVVVQSATLQNGSNKWISSEEDLSSPIQIGSVPRVAVDNQGNAVAVWGAMQEDGNMVLQAAKLPFGSKNWVSMKDYSSPDETIESIEFAVDNAGNIVAVWEASLPGNKFVIKSSSLAYNALTWTPAVTLSSPNKPSWFPQVAMDKKGNAVAIWWERGNSTIIKAARLPVGTFQWNQTKDIAKDVWDHQLAVDTNGNAIVVWRSYSSQGNNSIQYSILANDECFWTTPVKLATTEKLAKPGVALDNSGNAFIVWLNLTKGSLQGTTVPFGKKVSKPSSLITLGNVDFQGEVPAFALSGNGTAVIVYSSFDKSLPKMIRSVSSKDIFSGQTFKKLGKN